MDNLSNTTHEITPSEASCRLLAAPVYISRSMRLRCQPPGAEGGKGARLWLTSLRESLERAPADASSAGGGSRGKETLTPALCMLLAALTLHESPLVCRQAVLAVASVPAMFPLMGILFVPLLVYLLQSSTAPGALIELLGIEWNLNEASLEFFLTNLSCSAAYLRALSPMNQEIFECSGLLLSSELSKRGGRREGRSARGGGGPLETLMQAPILCCQQSPRCCCLLEASRDLACSCEILTNLAVV